jgi:hypothetical protein
VFNAARPPRRALTQAEAEAELLLAYSGSSRGRWRRQSFGDMSRALAAADADGPGHHQAGLSKLRRPPARREPGAEKGKAPRLGNTGRTRPPGRRSLASVTAALAYLSALFCRREEVRPSYITVCAGPEWRDVFDILNESRANDCSKRFQVAWRVAPKQQRKINLHPPREAVFRIEPSPPIILDTSSCMAPLLRQRSHALSSRSPRNCHTHQEIRCGVIDCRRVQARCSQEVVVAPGIDCVPHRGGRGLASRGSIPRWIAFESIQRSTTTAPAATSAARTRVSTGRRAQRVSAPFYSRRKWHAQRRLSWAFPWRGRLRPFRRRAGAAARGSSLAQGPVLRAQGAEAKALLLQ